MHGEMRIGARAKKLRVGLVLAIIAASCGGDGGKSGSAAAVARADSNGSVGMVSSEAAVPAEAAFDRSFDNPPAVFELVKDLTIGNSTIPQEIVTRVSGLKINRKGLIFIMQPEDKTIRVFDSTGKFVRTMGQAGQGPGEFTGFGFFGFNHDSLWVTDPSQNRVSLFGANGIILRYLATSVEPPSPQYEAAPPLAYLENGTILVKFTGSQEGSGSDAKRPADLVMRATSEGKLIDTLRVLAMSLSREIEPGRNETAVRGGREMTMRIGPTFASRPINSAPYLVVAADGAQLLIIFRAPPTRGDSAQFTLVRIGADGKVISEVAYGYTPRPVTQKLIDSLMPMPPDSAPARAKERMKFLRDNADIPKFLPPVNRMIIGRDNTIWVASDWADKRERWTIIGEDNKVVGSVDMPRGFRVMQVDRNRAWGVEADADSIPYVVRYRIKPRGG